MRGSRRQRREVAASLVALVRAFSNSNLFLARFFRPLSSPILALLLYTTFSFSIRGSFSSFTLQQALDRMAPRPSVSIDFTRSNDRKPSNVFANRHFHESDHAVRSFIRPGEGCEAQTESDRFAFIKTNRSFSIHVSIRAIVPSPIRSNAHSAANEDWGHGVKAGEDCPRRWKERPQGMLPSCPSPWTTFN